MALRPYIGNEHPEGQESELVPFLKGTYWTAQAYTAFSLVNPMMVARANAFSGALPDIAQFTGVERGPKRTRDTLFDLGTSAAGLRPAAILNRALRTRVTLDEGALYGLESYFSPFIESRMAKGHFRYSGIHEASLGGSKAFADIYDLGIAKRVSGNKIETSAAAWLASVTMHHPLLRTFSIYPALMNIAMPTDMPLDVSLFNFEAGLSDTKIGFTKHTVLYGQRFKKFKNDRLLAHGIDLYSHEGLESFNTRLQEAATDLRYEKLLEVQDQLKELGMADVQHQKLIGMTHKDFEKMYGGGLSQEEFNKLKMTIGEGPTLDDIFRRAGIDEHIAQELPMFMRLKDGRVSMGKYAHYTGTSLDNMDIVSEKAFAAARAHGKMGKHQYASKYIRTVEATAGLTDIDSERIDEKFIFLEDNTFDIGDPFKHSTAKDSIQTVYSRLTRLLDNPFDILSYFGMEETHAEKMARVQDIIEEAVGKSAGSAGTIYSEGRTKRVLKNIFMNRFGTGGDYTGGLFQNIKRSLLPGFVNLEQEKSAFIVLGRKSEMSHLSAEEFYDAMKEIRDEYVTKFKDADEGVLKLVGKEGVEAFKKEGMTPFVQMSNDVAYISATYTSKMRRLNVGMLGLGLAVGGAMDLIPIVREPFRILNRLRATIGESTGLMGYADSMEQVAPGSTSPLNALGFGLGGLFAGYFGAKTWQWNQLRGIKGGYEKAAMREAFEMKRAISNPYVRYMSEKLGFGSAKTMAGKFGMYGMAAGLIINAPFLPAQVSRLLFGSKSTAQLDAEYSGRAQVPVMKGRWWEAGVSHFGGEKLAYYRPSMMVATPKEARDMDLYGAPNSNFMNLRSTLEQMFTYNIEDRNYWRRPYFTSSSAFGDMFGPFSPILNATVGEFIKPTRYMHMGDVPTYSDEEGDPYLMAIPGSGKYAKAAESSTPGEYARINLSDEDSPMLVDKLTSRESFYRLFQEAPGLVGFVGQSYIEGTTGQAIIYDDQPFAERADRMTSGGRMFWDMELGGLGGMCFVAGSQVYTRNGMKNIEDISQDDYVLSKDGSYRKVLELYKNKLDGRQLREIKTTLGKSLKCTDNHLIPVLRRKRYKDGHAAPFNEKNYSIIEIPASEIIRGDYLFVPIDKTEEELIIDLAEYNDVYTDKYVYAMCCQEWANVYEEIEQNPNITRDQLRNLGYQDKIAKEVLYVYRTNSVPTRYNRYLEIDPNIAYLLGWYIAEGCFNSKTAISLTMNIKEIDYAEHLGSIIKTKLGLTYSIYLKPETGSLVLQFSCWALVGLFESVGKGAFNKCIPEEIKRLPELHIMALVCGLILGDGWVNLNKKPYFGGFTSVSKKLVQDLSSLLLRLKVDHVALLDYLEIPKNSCLPNGNPRKPSLRNYIKLNQGRYDYSFFDGSYLVTVNSNEILDEKHEFVYDIHVEDLHYYTVDGICVHNSEPIRRMFPSRRFAEDWQNPIANDQPSWMPGEKEMINFKIGDPFAKIPAGEMRVPGPGYTLLRPDLEGVNPEDYDTATRLSVLANIAPYSKAYKRELKRFKKEQESGLLTEQQLELGATAQLMRRNMIQAHKYNQEADNLSILSGYYKGAAELFRSNPFERLVPFSPGHKFLAQRTAIEEYREYLEYGGDMAKWTNPVEDFVSRFARAWVPFFSTDIDPAVSEKVQEARRVNGIFNAMEYLKGQSGGKATNFRSQNSIPGVNPYGANLEDIVKAMPGGEKPYFYAFAEEESLARQKIILSMVPEEHHRIYKAIWARKLVHQIRDENNSVFARNTANKAASIISNLAENEATYLTEGFFSKRQVSEAEFRNNIATAIIEKYDGNVPNREWLGWNKDVKLSDVKLQYVMDEGMDIHDFNLWEPQVRELAYKDKIPDITDEYVHSDFYNVAQAVQAMTVTRDYGYSGGYNDSTNVYVTPTDRELQQVYKQDEY